MNSFKWENGRSLKKVWIWTVYVMKMTEKNKKYKRGDFNIIRIIFTSLSLEVDKVTNCLETNFLFRGTVMLKLNLSAQFWSMKF